MRLPRQFLLHVSLLLAAGSADCLAQIGDPGQIGGPMRGRPPVDEESTPSTSAPSSSESAVAAFKAGEGYVIKAQESDSEAAKTPDDKRKAKALSKSSSLYDKALGKFEDAVEKDPGLVDAWNDIGLCDLHLDAYDEAVKAYTNALELKPSYSEAYKNRAEAYLELDKITEAKSDYMNLLRLSRPLADQLTTYMHQWIEERKRDPKGLSSEDLDAFIKWANERATIGQ